MDSTVFTAQAAPPVEYAELNITPVAAAWVTPLASVQEARDEGVAGYGDHAGLLVALV